MRPALKPGLLAVWRDRDTLQIGIDPRRAIALRGMATTAGILNLLDGSRDRGQVLAAASELGIPADLADRIISLLAAAGALQDFPAATLRTLTDGLRTRLAPELATAALAHGDGDGGARTLVRRREALIHVHGSGRLGLGIAGLLTAAGVRQVTSIGPAVPGALPHPGPASAAAGPAPIPAITAPDCPPAAAARPATPGTGGRRAPRSRPAGPRIDGRLPDLAILADHRGLAEPATLMQNGVPHLVASAREAIGVVGPLVVPGRSACLRCLDLARAERDPAWPLILAQLACRAADPPACDVTLTAAVAAQAAGQALRFIDRAAPAEAVTNGTLELVLPGWQWHRRTWQPHPRCACGRRAPL